MDDHIMRCGIISSCQSAATSEIGSPEHVFIVEQRYIKYWTFAFTFLTCDNVWFCQQNQRKYDSFSPRKFNWVSDTTVVYFGWMSGNIVIAAKLNDKSHKFKCKFSYNYAIASYSVKTDVGLQKNHYVGNSVFYGFHHIFYTKFGCEWIVSSIPPSCITTAWKILDFSLASFSDVSRSCDVFPCHRGHSVVNTEFYYTLFRPISFVHFRSGYFTGLRLVHLLWTPVITIQCAAKKYPLKFFAIFLATAQNFYMKFHTLITRSWSHKIAKQHRIIFNHHKVIKFLRWPRSHFWCSRNVYRTKNPSCFVMWYKKSIVIWTTK